MSKDFGGLVILASLLLAVSVLIVNKLYIFIKNGYAEDPVNHAKDLSKPAYFAILILWAIGFLLVIAILMLFALPGIIDYLN